MPTNINDKLISWASDIDPGTIRQAEKTARLPIVEGHVALMPDAHVGIGATVGSVIPTKGAVIPAAVGVDIGCGMIAAELDVTEDQLPDTLEPLLGRIERAIPAGVGQGHDDVGPQRRPVARRRTSRPPSSPTKQVDQGGQAVRHARLGQPLRRAVHRRARPGVGGAALGQPGHRQPAGADAHRQGPAAGQGPRAAAGGPGPGVLRRGHAGVRGLHRRHAVGPGLRPGQPRPDDGQRDARGVRVPRLRPRDAAHQLPPQLHPARGPRRRGAVDHPQGRDQGRRRRPRRHPRLDGHAQLHRARARATRRAGRRARTAPAAATAGPRPRSCSPPPTSPSRWAARCGSTDRADALVDEIPSAYKDIDQVMADQADLVEVLHTLHQVLNYKGT